MRLVYQVLITVGKMLKRSLVRYKEGCWQGTYHRLLSMIRASTELELLPSVIVILILHLSRELTLLWNRRDDTVLKRTAAPISMQIGEHFFRQCSTACGGV